MKKKKMTKVVLMLVIVMSVLLAGCGSSDDADDPNIGVYKAKSAEMSGFKVGVEEVFEDGFIIELKKKGKAHLEADGEDGGTIKWTLDGDKFHAEGGGAVLDGTLSDGVITKKDFDAYVNNMAASDTGLLEDDLELMQDFWSKNAKKDDPIKMITDELPDPELLHLYK